MYLYKKLGKSSVDETGERFGEIPITAWTTPWFVKLYHVR